MARQKLSLRLDQGFLCHIYERSQSTVRPKLVIFVYLFIWGLTSFQHIV